MADETGQLRVLVTGAGGLIGRLVMEHLDDQYDLVGLARDLSGYATVIADVSDLDALVPTMEGIDAVIHLAADSAVEAPWERVLPDNLIGTYNVFEAARQAGVGTVVFASSNHAIGMYELDGAPSLYDLGDDRVYDERVETRPDSLYGVSKLYGEALGRMHHDLHGMRVVCLRIGSVRADDDPSSPAMLASVPAPLAHLSPEERRRRMRATWLSRRDCAELIARAIDADDVGWAVVYGISDNPRQFWSLRSARELLGYEPRDRAPE